VEITTKEVIKEDIVEVKISMHNSEKKTIKPFSMMMNRRRNPTSTRTQTKLGKKNSSKLIKDLEVGIHEVVVEAHINLSLSKLTKSPKMWITKELKSRLRKPKSEQKIPS